MPDESVGGRIHLGRHEEQESTDWTYLVDTT